jgi:hypothetical protein
MPAKELRILGNNGMREAKSWPGLSTRGLKKSNEIASPINER